MDNKFDVRELKYVYSLEHVMPQKWETCWSPAACPVINTDDDTIITDDEKAAEVRRAAVSELGNMTLLNSSLNSSLRNYEFARKVTGQKS